MRKSSVLKIGLGFLTLVFSGCKDIQPEYDRCVIIFESKEMFCIPINQPGKADYSTPLDESKTGYQCLSPDDVKEVAEAINEARERCGD